MRFGFAFRRRTPSCRMFFLWLVGRKNGSAQTHKKRYQRLPSPKWFQDILAGAPSRCKLDANRGNVKDSLELSAIVRLSPGIVYEHMLSFFSREESLWWDYMGNPRDAYTWVVDDDCYVHPAWRVTTSESNRVVGGLCPQPFASPTDMPHADCEFESPGGRRETMAAYCARRGVDLFSFNHPCASSFPFLCCT